MAAHRESSTTMDAICIFQPGGPDVLRMASQPMPIPAQGQALIRVAYAGVNRPDCLQRRGLYAPPPGASDIPGLEISGEVIASHTPDLVIGAQICALVAGGGYAPYCLVDAPLALPVPAGLTLQEAAALPENVFTVYDNVITRGALKSGETLLVHGGSSGIGSIAIQMAKAWGARVITTARGAEKTAFCRALGADLAMDYTTEDFVPAVLAATMGQGVDVVLDMVGGDYVARNLACLATDGRLVQIAFQQGAKVTLDLGPLMVKRQTLTGSTLRPRSLVQKAAIARAVERDIWPFIIQGKIRPQIDTLFPLHDAAKAHTRMEANTHMGKILLVMPH